MANTDAPLDVYAAPYVPLKLRQVNSAPATVVPCQPAPAIDFADYVQTFAGRDFLPPDDQMSALGSSTDLEALTSENYWTYFTNALDQERKATQEESDMYALYQVRLVPANDPRYASCNANRYQNTDEGRGYIYHLQVPGLRESTLRIEVGDIVHIRQIRYHYNGEIITAPQVLDHFGQPIELPNALDQRHDAVVYGIDRLSEKLSLRIDHLQVGSLWFNACFTPQMHRFFALFDATKHAKWLLPRNDWMRSMLFPDERDGSLQRALNPANVHLDSWDLQLNFEQRRAIRNIIDSDYGNVPFLITGPPGTGKTKIVVETTLQLIACDVTVRMLLCAPSDSAADMLVQRLRKHFDPRELLRLNAYGRSFPEVPGDVLPYCHVDQDIFSLPPFAELMEKRIVVTTCRDAQILRQARVTNQDLYAVERNMSAVLHPHLDAPDPPLHWSGVIIDEAAQATEPEALIPLLVVAPPEQALQQDMLPLVVMVGDHNQLGPRTALKDLMIQRSLFERLLLRPLYCHHPLARSKQIGGAVPLLTQAMLPIIKPPFMDLVRNYRSHAAILAIPSSLFYNDTLEPLAENMDSLLAWSHFTGKVPVLFADNRSLDEIEHDGGGWFNIGEADKAIQYAIDMLDQKLLQQRDICIMSPFRAQVKVLRAKARALNLYDINIGPLEAFQGLESRMVILCTTRSRDRFIDQDIARGLGIIHEPRRFNVAMTRAREGLVVIGNAEVLLEDENWASFIAFCRRMKAWEGLAAGIHVPYSRRIRISRLEKQLEYRNRVESHSHEVNGLASKIGGLSFGMTEEEAFYESGISAESEVRTQHG